jgi:hypothetical protein
MKFERRKMLAPVAGLWLHGHCQFANFCETLN